MDALKWLWSYAKKHRIGYLAVILLSALFVICAFVNPVLLGRFVDDVIRGGKTHLLFFYALLLISAALLKEAVTYVRQIILEKTSQDVIKSIRNNLYNKLQSLDMAFFDRTKTGDLMSRLTMDTDAIRLLLASTIPNIINQALYIIIGFTLLFSVSPTVTLCLLIPSPLIALCAYLLAKYDKPKHMNIRETNAELNTVVRENIEGNRVVKAYAREEYEISKFEKFNQKYMDAFMDHVRCWIQYGPSLQFFVNLITVIFLMVGGIFVLNSTITIGAFTTINGSLWCIVTPMATIGDFIAQFQQFSASSTKIRRLQEQHPAIYNQNVKKRDTNISGKIQFKNVTFTFDGERVLKHINFTANPGDTVAIIGPTGSGKSTIINLLARFYDPTYGAVYIDDINVKNIDLKTLHQNIASASQDVFLFSDTIRNNIAYGSPTATLDDVIRVAKEADAHEFISKLPDGYDTVVGERGSGLSGGQRQRVSLARALLKNPAILVLDDTTSALDMETEFSIQENLKKTFKTKIIIAHRISSVKNADLILVLNHGTLIEWGTHEKLMQLNGYYKSVFDHQFGDFDNMPKYHINHPTYAEMAEREASINGSKQI